jgi:prepilin-type N-terminal cleavage/methylation domain-containing protein
LETTGYVSGVKPANVSIPVLGGAERPRAGAVYGYRLRTKPSPNSRSVCKREAAFSLTELVVALAIALILAGIGLPSFLRAYHTYQLTNAAQQVADILRLTRYEAIRLNKPMYCVIQPTGAMTYMWADPVSTDSQPAAGQKVILLQSSGNIIASSMPGGLQTAANTGTLTPVGTTGNVKFDARGAVVPTGQLTVAYLANTDTTDPGYRAVILLPAGSIQIWTSDATGNWQEIR